MGQDTLVTGGGAMAQFQAAQERIAADFRAGRGVKAQDLEDLQAGLDGAQLAACFGTEDQMDVDIMRNWVAQLQIGL